jgi:quinol-cytochrome oxidoreductase complex cytochrome b subunit
MFDLQVLRASYSFVKWAWIDSSESSPSVVQQKKIARVITGLLATAAVVLTTIAVSKITEGTSIVYFSTIFTSVYIFFFKLPNLAVQDIQNPPVQLDNLQ